MRCKNVVTDRTQIREANMKREVFMFLKERAETHLLKRRLNKLAQIHRHNKLYSKGFETIKWKLRIQKKANKICAKKRSKTLKGFYILWRSNFKGKSIVNRFRRAIGLKQTRKVFKFWKDYHERNGAVNHSVQSFIDKRNDSKLKFVMALWKKFASFSHQKTSFNQALFVTYIFRLKKRVLAAWYNRIRKSHLLENLAYQVSESHKHGIMHEHFYQWMIKNRGFRNHRADAISYASCKSNERLRTIIKSWAIIAKERIIERNLVDLRQEQVRQNLLTKSMQAWISFNAVKQTRKQIIDVRLRFTELRIAKQVFFAFQEWMNMRQKNRIIFHQIRQMQKTKKLKSYLARWVDLYNDNNFELSAVTTIDK